MSAEVIQSKYEELVTIARRFEQQAQTTRDLQHRVRRGADALRNGGWEGRGSAAFSGEMEQKVFPTLRRLIESLEQAQAVTLEIKGIIERAEEEAAQPFKDGKGSSDESFLDKALGFVDDLFSGAGAELGDMLKGIGNLVTHPIDTLKGMWYGITHPGELWNALKQPYVED